MKYLKYYEGFNRNSDPYAINLGNRIKKVLNILGLKLKISHNTKNDRYLYEIDSNFLNNKFGLLSLMAIPYHNLSTFIVPNFNSKGTGEYKLIIMGASHDIISSEHGVEYLNQGSLHYMLLEKISKEIFWASRNHLNTKEIRTLGLGHITTIPILHQIIEYFSENMRMDDEDIINGTDKEIIIPDSIIEIIETNVRNNSNSLNLIKGIKKKQPLVYKKIKDDDITKGIILNDMGFGD